MPGATLAEAPAGGFMNPANPPVIFLRAAENVVDGSAAACGFGSIRVVLSTTSLKRPLKGEVWGL